MAVINWAKPLSGNFNTARKWIGGVAPGPDDAAYLADSPGAAYTVTVSSNEQVNAISSDAGAQLDITGGSTFSVFGIASDVNFKGAVKITNGATLALSFGGGLSVNTLALDGAHLLLSGAYYPPSIGFSGEMDFNGAASNITSNAKNSYFDNNGNIIDRSKGASAIGSPGMQLTNSGIIETVAGSLTLDTSGIWITNNRLIESAGGNLIIKSSFVYNGQIGSTILAQGAGATVTLTSADIYEGTLQTLSGGQIVTGDRGSILDGTGSAVTIQGRIVIRNSDALTVQGAITNSGVIALGGHGSATTLIVGASNATLSGGGRVVLENNSANQITGATDSATLDNLDNVIAGAGDVGNGHLTLVVGAKGVIDADLAVALIIDTGANTIANSGLIEASGAGGGAIRSAVSNTGVLMADGGNLTVNGAVTGSGHAVISGGNLSFASGFSENVAFTGSTGVLELAYSQGYTGTITGFSTNAGTSLDLRDIAFSRSTTATFSGTTSGGTLTVTDGTHTANIRLSGDYTGSTFVASGDGHGGVTVIDPPAALTRSGAQCRFVAAMACFAPTTAHIADIASQRPGSPIHLPLAEPHVAFA
ncbi:MAG TPA: hypothetical protein VII63_05150 [Caulobacteraceae bacterium]